MFNGSSSCHSNFLLQCQACQESLAKQYNCSLPGLESFTPGQYEGHSANFLSFATSHGVPNLPVRAREFEACTGGRIHFSDAHNVWEDPVQDLGTKTSRGASIVVSLTSWMIDRSTRTHENTLAYSGRSTTCRLRSVRWISHEYVAP